MAARLGKVIYWLSLAIAILAALLAAFVFYVWYAHDFLPSQQGGEGIIALQLAVLSFGSWLIGRAILYILAGR